MPREKKEKKVKEPRRKRIKVLDFATLPDAIVDGKFVVKERGRVMFERAMWDTHKIEIHRGVVMSVRATYISIYDDTTEQWYCFDLHTPPLIKAAHVEDLIEGTIPTYDVLYSQIHLPMLRAASAGDTAVRQVGLAETGEETPSDEAQDEPGPPDEEVIALPECDKVETDEVPTQQEPDTSPAQESVEEVQEG